MKSHLILALLLCNLTACFHSSRSSKTQIQVTQVTITASVKDRDDLPNCNINSYTTQAYVSSEDVSLFCNGRSWLALEQHSPEQRLSVRDRPALRFYEWQDSLEKKRWRLSQTQPLAREELTAAVCQGIWKLPTREELAVAQGNGLFSGIKAHGGIAFEQAWARESLTAGSPVSLFAEASPDQGTGTAGVYCVTKLKG